MAPHGSSKVILLAFALAASTAVVRAARPVQDAGEGDASESEAGGRMVLETRHDDEHGTALKGSRQATGGDSGVGATTTEEDSLPIQGDDENVDDATDDPDTTTAAESGRYNEADTTASGSGSKEPEPPAPVVDKEGGAKDVEPEVEPVVAKGPAEEGQSESDGNASPKLAPECAKNVLDMKKAKSIAEEIYLQAGDERHELAACRHSCRASTGPKTSNVPGSEGAAASPDNGETGDAIAASSFVAIGSGSANDTKKKEADPKVKTTTTTKEPEVAASVEAAMKLDEEDKQEESPAYSACLIECRQPIERRVETKMYTKFMDMCTSHNHTKCTAFVTMAHGGKDFDICVPDPCGKEEMQRNLTIEYCTVPNCTFELTCEPKKKMKESKSGSDGSKSGATGAAGRLSPAALLAALALSALSARRGC